MMGSFVATPVSQALQTNCRVWKNFSTSRCGEPEFFRQNQQEQWVEDLYSYEFSLGPKKFHTLDIYEGRTNEPQTLHKYLYAHSNPVSNIDPSGNLSVAQTVAVNAVIGALINVGFTAVGGTLSPGFYERDLAAIAKDFGVSAAIGAVGGGSGTIVSIWLKARILAASIRPFLPTLRAASTGGAVAGFSTQLLTEIWGFVMKDEEVTVESVTASGKRVIAFTFGGFVAGGMFAKFNITRSVKIPGARPPLEKGLTPIPWGGVTGYREVFNGSGIAGVAGGGVFGNMLAYYYEQFIQ